MNRQKNTRDLVDNLADGDKAFSAAVNTFMERRSLAKQLAVLRAVKGVSQSDMAQRIGVSQGQISKIEHATDEQLTVKDIADYARALGIGVTVNIQAGQPIADAATMVKFHAFEAKKHLDLLAAMAGDDPKFKQAVADFYVEAMVNIVALCLDSAKKLEPQPRRMMELLRLSAGSTNVELTVADDAAPRVTARPPTVPAGASRH